MLRCKLRTLIELRPRRCLPLMSNYGQTRLRTLSRPEGIAEYIHPDNFCVRMISNARHQTPADLPVARQGERRHTLLHVGPSGHVAAPARKTISYHSADHQLMRSLWNPAAEQARAVRFRDFGRHRFEAGQDARAVHPVQPPQRYLGRFPLAGRRQEQRSGIVLIGHVQIDPPGRVVMHTGDPYTIRIRQPQLAGFAVNGFDHSANFISS